jgi:hypothetical protein
VVGLVLFAKFVLPTLILIIFIICVFFGDAISALLTPKEPEPLLTLGDDGVSWEVTKFMFEAVSSVGNVLTEVVYAPKTSNDLYDGTDYRGMYNGATLLKHRLVKKQADIDPGYVKSVLQGSVDARVRDGYLSGFAWAVASAVDVPVVKVATIALSDMYIHFGILLTNTEVSVQAARLSDNPAPPPSVDGTDPLFKGGD